MERRRPPQKKSFRPRLFLAQLVGITLFTGYLDEKMTDGSVRAAAIEMIESTTEHNDPTEQAVHAPEQPTAVVNSSSKWVGNPEAYTIIDSLNLPENKRAYVKFTYDCTLKALNAGSTAHPAVLVGMSILETGYGQDGLSPVSNNHFGIKGAGDAGTVRIGTREVIQGQDVYMTDGFKAFSDSCGSHLDMTPMHQRLAHYHDVAPCSDTPLNMLNAVQHQADPETCEVIAYQGEQLVGGRDGERVLGHATDPRYVAVVLDVIDSVRAEELFLPA